MSQKEVSEKDAIKIVKNMFGEDKIVSIENKPVQGKTRIPTYTFHITFKGRDKK